ncbi:MAG TPA: bifunctional 4-hydroxy-2-oxoglutarate aldolase/2-dehydro-3-deoxy-phosphogluconate aldolase [Firmicutes bacterium]|nr:bifunctional 4-hydroxy-2-oxoglutarate aldolase/2-dehydro-3-deoxy-phosphogluconate aldolase [Bacillota bacterium]
MDLRDIHLKTMIDTGVVAIIRAQSSDELVDVATALKNGGLKAIEVTMTTPGALDVISQVAKQMGDEVIIGVGSVLDSETARMAILAGAQFVVSPVLNRDVIALCKRYSKVVVPGAFSPTEILAAWEAGADVVKVFPATRLGPSFFKDIKGPLPQIRLSPTGGVNLENAGDFIKAGASFVGVGTALVDKKMIAERRWDDLSALARKYLEVVRAARQ